MKFIRHITYSLSLRLILVFLITAIVSIATFRFFVASTLEHHAHHQLLPHLLQYIDYLQDDMGSPPSVEYAKRLTEKLPINIQIKSTELDWSSKPEAFPSLESIRWTEQYTTPEGLQIKAGFRLGRFIAIIQQQDYQIILWSRWKEPYFYKFLAFSVLLSILALLYAIVHYLFQPIQQIKQGVQTIGAGQLSHRIQTKRRDELGDLTLSINQMADDIEHMLEAKRELLLAISHELRSPLTRAKVSVALLEESKAQNNIQRDLLEMEQMITELLEAERLKGRHQVLNTDEVALNSLVKAVVDEHFPEAAIQLDLANNLPLQTLDSVRIKLVIRNLLDNALKHQLNDQPVVTVKTAQYNGQSLLSITDYGPGISADQLAKLTEPFYRVDSSRQRKTGGFGLGLYLVKLIVEAHQGELVLESEVGKGLCVVVKLPLL